ncbi:formylglycine-generating enzyme family protein [Marinicella marina]|nr:formylglycine-generating enzyme family protein [Marinicella marina]MDJ1140481.1 formylglycine-generating enzyme family protein [Marinicella marina]
MSIKEISMLLLGMVLIFALYYLRTNEQIFTATPAQSTNNESGQVDLMVATEPEQTTLPPAVLDQVEIPDWLGNKGDYELDNLTLEDLLELAQLAHEQGHDFFPENQNALVYLINAKAMGVEDPKIEELLTTIHAALYSEAELAIENYDATKLTALTARLKSIDENDNNITNYINQISIINTLERLTTEAEAYLLAGKLYEQDRKDAVNTTIKATNIDANYQPITTIKEQILLELQARALRAAQELDFLIAEQQIEIMRELDSSHDITMATIDELQSQKQNRFAYLDQQFYNAIQNINLARANDMIDALIALDIPPSQLNNYQQLLQKTQTYGPFDLAEEFNDLLANGNAGPTMVVLPTAEFYMGSQTGPKHQRPRHLVEIDYGFAVAKNEVTVADFRTFIETTGYTTTAELRNRAKIYDERTGRFKQKFNINWRHDYLGKYAEDYLPVIHVSWQDAKAYADWLAQSTGEPYRLISESEFEYVLADGENALYPWGDAEPVQVWGNFSGAKDKFKKSRIRWREGFKEYADGYWGPAPVGSFVANMLGLNDLSGNVMEWVDDCWHDSYIRAPGDGSAWVNRGCENRVIRGGSWGSANEEYQIHHRLKAATDFTDPRLGFRVAKTLSFK